MCKRDAASAASLLSFLYSYNKKIPQNRKSFCFTKSGKFTAHFYIFPEACESYPLETVHWKWIHCGSGHR